MILGCIDIGSNTTRLLVADARAGGLRALAQERVFTRLGHGAGPAGEIAPHKLQETAQVVAAQARTASALGAVEIAAVATAAARGAPNRERLVALVGERSGLRLRVLSGPEEAGLCFAGASALLQAPVRGQLAVVDVGGGSTEVAVGPADGTMQWCESLPLGSALLTHEHLRSDPPSAAQLDAARRHAAQVVDTLRAPPAHHALAVGGTAASLAGMAPDAINPAALAERARTLSGAPAASVAAELGLHPQRVRLLPAGIIVLEELCRALALPLRIARGGLREGVIFELLRGRETL